MNLLKTLLESVKGGAFVDDDQLQAFIDHHHPFHDECSVPEHGPAMMKVFHEGGEDECIIGLFADEISNYIKVAVWNRAIAEEVDNYEPVSGVFKTTEEGYDQAANLYHKLASNPPKFADLMPNISKIRDGMMAAIGLTDRRKAFSQIHTYLFGGGAMMDELVTALEKINPKISETTGSDHLELVHDAFIKLGAPKAEMDKLIYLFGFFKE